MIIFNFPHTGGKSKIKKNRQLLKDFFLSAVTCLCPNEGVITVTLCKGQGGTTADQSQRLWHNSWQVVAMATYAGLILRHTCPFNLADFQQYSSTGFRSQDKHFNTEGAIMYTFSHPKPRTEISTETIWSHLPKHIQVKLNKCIIYEPNNPVSLTRKLILDKLSKSEFSVTKIEISKETIICDNLDTNGHNYTSIPSLVETLLDNFADDIATVKKVNAATVPMYDPISIRMPLIHTMWCAMKIMSSYNNEEMNSPLHKNPTFDTIVVEILEECGLDLNINITDVSQEYVGNIKVVSMLTGQDTNGQEVNIGYIYAYKKDYDIYQVVRLNIDNCVLLYYNIPDQRLVWSKDDNFHKQFESDTQFLFRPFSLYAPIYTRHELLGREI